MSIRNNYFVLQTKAIVVGGFIAAFFIFGVNAVAILLTNGAFSISTDLIGFWIAATTGNWALIPGILVGVVILGIAIYLADYAKKALWGVAP